MKRELVFISILGGILFGIGAFTYRASWKTWGTQDFYQDSILPPAVMLACGKGIGTHEPRVPPYPIDAFLLQKEQEGGFDCKSIPAGTVAADLYDFQYAHFYLILFIGIFWSIFGISWTGLWIFFGLLYAVTNLTTYALFRNLFSKIKSAGLTLWFALSPLQLTFLPSLRDYSRTFFIVFTLAGLLYWIRTARVLSARAEALFMLGMGAVLGVGYRFRSDMILCLLFLALVLCIFLKFREWKKTGLLLGASLSGFFLASTVLLIPWSHCQKHVWGQQLSGNLLHGQMTSQIRELNLVPGLYEIGSEASDRQVLAVASSYAERVLGQTFSHFYLDARPIRGLFLESMALFPADYLLKALSSISTLSKLPLTYENRINSKFFLTWKSNKLRVKIFRKYSRYFGLLLLIMALAIVSQWKSHREIGGFVLLATLFFFTYPSLRFQQRHLFPMEVIPLLCLGLVFEKECWKKKWWQGIKLASVKGLAGVLVLGLLISGVRFLQERTLRRYQELVAQSNKEKVKVRKVGSEFLFSSALLPSPLDPYPRFETQYLALEFDGDRCSAEHLQFQVLYDDVPDQSLSRSVQLERRPGLSQYYFPVYRFVGTAFRGVAMDPSSQSCWKGASIVKEIPKVPFLLNFHMVSSHRYGDLFITFPQKYWRM